MDHRQRTLNELALHATRVSERVALAGLDGFVDTIVHPVAQRHGQGDNFTPISTIAEFGQRILAASGKSTNIELFPVMQKLGGNGPIMANALLAAGVQVHYIGALGRPAIHGVFSEFAARAHAVSVAEPSLTTAAEFADGKIMLGNTVSLDAVTYENVVAAVGDEREFRELVSRTDLVALVNWTMIPNMTALFRALLARIAPALPARRSPRVWFFDLADPEKRSRADLVEALRVIAEFQQHGAVTLGLNLKEAQQVAAALDLPFPAVDATGLQTLARAVRDKLGIGTVVVHPRESAACATPQGTAWVPGPFCENPKITTGAGDHFNAGFVTAQLLGLSAESCLTIGVCFSGYYVRTALSPSLNDVEAFLRGW
jgi:sugar/nucleoside kinase (ribokinase family)